MAIILFKAYKDNKEILGEVEASSNKEALLKIKQQGYENIEIFNDAAFQAQEDNLKFLDKTSRIQYLKLEQINLRKPTFKNSFLQFLIGNKIDLTLSIFLILLGFILNIKTLIVIGALWMIFRIGLFLYSYKTISLYQQIYIEFAFGNYIKTLGLISRLSKLVKHEKIEADLNSKKAQIIACKGHLDYALDIIKEYKDIYEEQMPGLYNSKKAALYYIARDYQSCLKEAKEAYNLNPSYLTAIDLALYNAKVGDINYAKELIEDINISEVPTHGKKFYYMIKGIIAHKSKDFQSAKIEFEKMMKALNPFLENPIFWGSISLAIGYYALLLYDINQKEKALELLKEGTVKILNIHSNDYLREELHKRYPTLITNKPYCKKAFINYI